VLRGNLAFFGRHDTHGYHTHNVGIYLGNDKYDRRLSNSSRKGLRMLSCHYGPGDRAATVSGVAVRRVAARRAGARLAVLLAVLGPVLGSSPARAAVGTAGLLPGQTLLAGQSISDGRDILTMQADGNLVLYARSIPVWASNTAGHGGAQLVMQADGNLVVAAPGGRPLWTAGTGGHSGSVLVMKADGDAVLDAPGHVTLWSTNTSKQTYVVVQLPAHGWDRTSSAA